MLETTISVLHIKKNTIVHDMKVIHIESGLGNQMLSYCEYLSMKQANPNDDCYIENIIYDIPECNSVINQWNGYELKRIFNIDAPNIQSLFTNEQWQSILDDIKASKFWEKEWNYPIYFPRIFKKYGLDLIDTHCDFEKKKILTKSSPKKGTIRHFLKHSYPAAYWKRYKQQFMLDKMVAKLNYTKELFPQSDKNLFAGQKLSFKHRNSGIERIEETIRQTFIFPEITDTQNLEVAKKIKNCEAVAIHVRRGDMLNANLYCYRNGYFKRALRYIKKEVQTPIFFIFCDPNTTTWVKQNAQKLGLNLQTDNINFVDWNKGDDSFRDMQLIGLCKHAVVTNSSFGWWGTWFIQNPNKITCSPDYHINTTHTF